MSATTGVNPRPLVPPMQGPPIKPGRVIVGGVTAVLSLFGGLYYFQHRRHQRRAGLEPHQAGSLSASSFERRSSTRASLVESRGTPLGGRVEPNRAQHRTMNTFRGQENPQRMFGDNGSYLHPVPQKDRGDGLAYTKKFPLRTTTGKTQVNAAEPRIIDANEGKDV
ncbi:hypothetical protein OF83DRAFT_1173557 [Amylostereum chailletii]|nr:hypothetical protein OF83DRAFT_1173557 [Amylostereum chailletii]